MRSRLFSALGLLTLILLGASAAHAKDLANRLGVGIKNNNSFDVPAVAAVYYPNADVGLTGSLGVDTAEDNSAFAFNVGIRRILFRENQMNFYYGGQAGLVNRETPTATGSDQDSGFELNVVFGAEFFFTGLESLGFTFEAGAGLTSMDETRFRTIADHPLRAGLIFYF
ncbi:MAG: organic solvent tolerance protein [Bdellovibrionales bacterium]